MPQWTAWPSNVDWKFALNPGARQEKRCALVLIVSDYSQAGLAALGGAAHDERRLSAMLGANGFSVVQGVAPTRAAILKALADFGRLAVGHDVAIIYCTGHGVESNGAVYLMPGDHPVTRGCSEDRLKAKAVSVDRLTLACRASRLNIVFFAGCRTLASTMTGVQPASRKKR